jgi:hypothetical protein
MNKTEWTMRDGKVVKLKEMTTLHIQNCVKMLTNNIEQREKHRPLIQSIQAIVSLLEKTKPKEASEKSSQILDQADTDLMVAETLLDEQQAESKAWLKIFTDELRLRETN